MKKEHILGILFFGGLWGISEAVLGDALYSSNVPYASVPLTVTGFVWTTLNLNDQRDIRTFSHKRIASGDCHLTNNQITEQSRERR